MNYNEKTICSERIFNGNIINVRVDEVQLPDGMTGRREIVEHNGGVAVVAFKNGRIILVRQFRKPVEETLLELPAGKIGRDEDPFDCALREMEEETGLVPVNLKLLTYIYPAPGFSSEKLYLYFADEFNEGTVNRDHDEFMDVVTFEPKEVLRMIENGEINDAKTICGFLLFNQFFR